MLILETEQNLGPKKSSFGAVSHKKKQFSKENAVKMNSDLYLHFSKNIKDHRFITYSDTS